MENATGSCVGAPCLWWHCRTISYISTGLIWYSVRQMIVHSELTGCQCKCLHTINRQSVPDLQGFAALVPECETSLTLHSLFSLLVITCYMSLLLEPYPIFQMIQWEFASQFSLKLKSVELKTKWIILSNLSFSAVVFDLNSFSSL